METEGPQQQQQQQQQQQPEAEDRKRRAEAVAARKVWWRDDYPVVGSNPPEYAVFTSVSVLYPHIKFT
jgi:hypothetical protein